MLKKKSKIFLLIILVTSVFSITLFSNSVKYDSTIENVDDTIDLYDLRVSGPQINITTPENKTYYGPMSGYYPGTFSFDDVLHGQDHPSWIGTDGDINDEIGNHKKVYEIIDNSGSTGGDTYHVWDSTQDHGTVESWMRFTSNTEPTAFLLRLDGTLLCALVVSNGNFMYTNNTGNHDISGAPTPQINTWYHIRFDFRGSYGSTYQGLASQYTYRIYIDGVAYGPYNYATTNDLNRFLVHTAIAATGVTIYWDAVGYSWDPDYNIGDNLNEGLLISFDLGFNPDWLGYSLDGQLNETILGNASIPFPTNDGLHSIQMFGNNSLGTMYESDVRYFTTKIINIVTPQNKVFAQPMSGYYPATFSFDDVLHGQDHPSWIGTDGDINDEVDNHKKVYEIIDNSGSTGGDTYHAWDSTQDHGTVESWMRFTSNTEPTAFLLRLDGTLLCALVVSNGNFMYTNNTGNHDISGAPTPQINTWYHIRFDFRGSYGSTYQGLASQYTYRIYIDGVAYGPYNYATTNDLNRFLVHTAIAATGVTIYWDAVGYSWDPDYNIGDNLNEGLLLSFENNTSLDWIGYSLDGQDTRTILGNITIPIPSDGLHAIIIFGNNSIGTMYQSKVRYFSVDVNAPISMISFTPYRDPNIVIKSTVFTITADDGLGSGVSLIRYKINDLSWNTYTGPFNLSTYDYDVYNITYQAIDGVGHIESENMITITLIPEPTEPGITGFNLFIMIGVISIITVILIKKKFK